MQRNLIFGCIKPKKLNRQSGEIIPNGRPRLKIAMTSIEKPIEIGLQRVVNRWGGHPMKPNFIAADFLMSFLGLYEVKTEEIIIHSLRGYYV